MPVHNAEIAEMFNQTAELLEIKGDNQNATAAGRMKKIPHAPILLKNSIVVGRRGS